MYRPSEVVLTHLKKPKYAGQLQPSKEHLLVSARVGSQGVKLQLQLALNSDLIVEEACFKALGCPALIAVADYGCSLLCGQPYQNFERRCAFSRMMSYLDLPATKHYVWHLLHEALDQIKVDIGNYEYNLYQKRC